MGQGMARDGDWYFDRFIVCLSGKAVFTTFASFDCGVTFARS